VIDQPGQARCHRGVAHRQRRRILGEDRVHGFDGAVAAERPRPGKHLVEHHAEREDVRAVIGGGAAHLLRRHVAGRPEHHASGRVEPRRGGGGGVGVRPGGQSRQSEVEYFHAAVAGDEDVLGLDVAMDHALFVRGRERAHDLRADVDRPPRRQRSGVEALAQCLALEQLHHGVRQAVGAAEVVNREDAGIGGHLCRPASRCPVSASRQRRRKRPSRTDSCCVREAVAPRSIAATSSAVRSSLALDRI